MAVTDSELTLTKADFPSDQETRWCPGCGDYAVLAAVQQLMPELGIPPQRIVFVSGIGCAGRFAYYMDTYGMHGIHGRAPALATGLAAARERPLDLGRDRRRRRAVDRRQPPDPRAAPQRAGEDPDVQQPDLRPDQGPGVADQRAREGHEVDAVRRPGRAVQPARARARRGGDVRRPHDRPRPPPHDRGAARGGAAQGQRVRRDLPELPGVQRRRVRGADRQGPGRLQPHPARARQADPLRAGRRARRRPRRRRRPRDRRRRRRRRGRAGGPRRPPRRSDARVRARPPGRRARPSRRRSASSAPSSARSASPRSAASSPPPARSSPPARSTRCCTRATPGPSPSRARAPAARPRWPASTWRARRGRRCRACRTAGGSSRRGR